MKEIVTIAGVGSRRIEDSERYSEFLNKVIIHCLKSTEPKVKVYTGGALGVDQRWENYYLYAGRRSDLTVFLPWNGFECKYIDGVVYKGVPHDLCVDYTVKYHPAPERLSDGALKLMNRNTCQILGEDLKSPIDGIVCWTLNGLTKGGTAQAIRIAEDNNIPVFNFGDMLGYDNEADVLDKLDEFLKMISRGGICNV